MRIIAKALILTFATGLVILLGTGVALAASVATSGLVLVQVSEAPGTNGGTNLTIPVPASLLHAGISGARYFASDDLRAARQELEPWRDAISQALDELEDCPNVELVRVIDGDEEVVVRKKGRNLLLRVQGNEETVLVSFPMSLARHAFSVLAG